MGPHLAGTFLNCSVVPEDVHRATNIWGPDSASLKGRMTETRPLTAAAVPLARRRFEPQSLHCDIFYVNKGAYLLSVTTPLGYVLISPLTSVATPVLRSAVRKMFGTYGQHGIDITQFSSDNEKGIIALFGDMSGMSVSQVTVGPGKHDHLAERIIR